MAPFFMPKKNNDREARRSRWFTLTGGAEPARFMVFFVKEA